MMRNRSTAFIPIIVQGDDNVEFKQKESDDTFVEIYAQQQNINDEASDHKAQKLDYDAIAVQLRGVGNLGQQGSRAVRAVRKLNLKAPRFALYQKFKENGVIQTQRLHSATPEGPTEGQSAELGLAIVLLMNICNTQTCQVFATGALSKSEVAQGVHGPKKGHQTSDVEVLAVKHMRRKLKLVLSRIQQGQFLVPAKGKEWLFFTPVFCGSEENFIKVSDLPESSELEANGVKVIPINWLSDAARSLKVYQKRYLWQDYLSQLILVSLLTILLLSSAWLTWLNTPVKKNLATDLFLVCDQKGNSYKLPLQRSLFGWSIYPEEQIGWELQVEDTTGWKKLLDTTFGSFSYGFHVAFVIVFEKSDPVLITQHVDGRGPIRVMPGELQAWGTLLDKIIENGILVILARHEPFDTEELTQTLLKTRLAKSSQKQSNNRYMDIHAAINALTKYDSYPLNYFFQISIEGNKCTPS